MGKVEKELLTVTQAAKRLGVSPNTLRSWADNGSISVVRLPSGHRRFHVSVVQSKQDELGFPALFEGGLERQAQQTANVNKIQADQETATRQRPRQEHTLPPQLR